MQLLKLAMLAVSAASAAAFQAAIPSTFTQSTSSLQKLEIGAPARATELMMGGKEKELRGRIASVKNTRKITEAMRLVAAAKVRRAQEAVLKGRPFVEALQSVIYGIVQQFNKEQIDVPILEARPVNHVTIALFTGDRGLCGGYNNYAIKKAEARMAELQAQGIKTSLYLIGKKGAQYFKRRDVDVVNVRETGGAPSAEDAAAIVEDLSNAFSSGETDAVEVVYSKFVSLIASTPSIRTVLPMSIKGIEMEGDEIFELTTEGGQLGVKTEKVGAVDAGVITQDILFEQNPIVILNAILPLYLDGQVLRMYQESVASELAARMQSMQAASDNAKQLGKDLTAEYNRARQASVTQEIMEIVAGADSASDNE